MTKETPRVQLSAADYEKKRYQKNEQRWKYWQEYQKKRYARDKEEILARRKQIRAQKRAIKEAAKLIPKPIKPTTLYPPGSFKDKCVRRMWATARNNAPRRGIEFNLALTDIVMEDYCPVCGVQFQPDNKDVFVTPSLDRIVNTRGYVPGNVAVIANGYNTLKSNGSVKEFELLLAWMKKATPPGEEG